MIQILPWVDKDCPNFDHSPQDYCLTKMPSPEQLEELIASKIAQSVQVSADDALLGFLDVDEETQRAVLDALRHLSPLSSINRYLRLYPALTCYGLAVAVSFGLQEEDVGGGAIYGAWEGAIGYLPPNNQRESLAHEFIRALDRLGLPVGTISPEHALHWHGGCYLFHSAILPHYVEPLRSALDSTQRLRPLPDPEDPDQIVQFASILAERVHPAQNRLRRTLRSSVGPFLIRRLVLWLLTHDDSLFPAHIRPLLEEQRTRGALLRAPFIEFDEIEGEMRLVLPAQSRKVADSGTRWSVGGRAYRANSEQPPLNLGDLGIEVGPFSVELSHLSEGRENCTFHLDAGIPAQRGFRVFDGTSGKERKATISLENTIELPPGQTFLVVFRQEAEVQTSHEEENSGDYRFVRFEATPGAEPLKILHEGREWRFKPKVRPGLYVNPSDEFRFHAKRMADSTALAVSYGKAPILTCAIPIHAEADPRIHFSTSVAPDSSKSVDLQGGSDADGVRFIDASQHLQQWIDTLLPAVHSITISFECGNQRMRQQLLHWKGLDRITIYGDLQCTEWPENLRSFSGYAKQELCLHRARRDPRKPELALSGLGATETERWEMPANRVKTTLVSADGNRFELPDGAEIEVSPHDERIIQFEFGGLFSVRLASQGREIGQLSSNRRIVSRYLSTLAADFGRSGDLIAENIVDLPGVRQWVALRWRTPQTARECRWEAGGANEAIWLIRKLSITGVAELRMKITDFSAKVAGQDTEALLQLMIPGEIETNTESVIGSGFSCSVRRKPENLVQVRVCFNREELRGAIWVAELECRLDESSEWQPVKSREAHGRLALVRLVLIGGTPEETNHRSPVAELFWGKFSEDLPANSSTRNLQGKEFYQWLKCMRWLVACKYPTPVWQQNGGRFTSIYRRLSSSCAFQGNSERAAWWESAVQELQQHAEEPEPVVIPNLLLTSSLKMGSTPLCSCAPESFSGLGLIERSFREVAELENGEPTNDLEYVRKACEGPRVDMDFLSHFSGWNGLIQMQPGSLGNLNIRSWLDRLRSKFEGLETFADGEVNSLLSPEHFACAVRKAAKRIDTLLSVSQQDHGHWLSGPISQLRLCVDGASSAANQILRNQLPGILLENRSRIFDAILGADVKEDRVEMLEASMIACLLIAAAWRANAASKITQEVMEVRLRTLIPAHGSEPEFAEKLRNQISLSIATAPELFSFFYLLFTYTIRPTA
jgi:hypothetical protein